MKPPLAIDLETTSLDPTYGSILSCAVSDGEKTIAWMIRDANDLEACKDVLARGGVVHYVPMESSWSELMLGNTRSDNLEDTALMAYRVDPGEPMRLASVVARHLPEYSGWKGSTEEQLADDSTGGSMLGVTPTSLLERNAVDAFVTRKLRDVLWPKMTAEEQELHKEDVAISMLTDRMSRRGMYVSEEELIKLRETCTTTMETEAAWLRDATGNPDLNPGSTKQLAEVFLSRGVELPKTDGGAPSVSGLALRVLRFQTSDSTIKALVDHVLVYRKAQDRLGDNVTAYATARDPGDGRIRGGFYWPGTVSWRPSCFAPNRLNVPRAGVRHLFAAPPGYTFLEVDLSQAELRIMAQLSGDPVLVSGFASGLDFHRRMGSRIYEIGEDRITSEQRYVGKKTNFSCGYFIGDDALWESFAKDDLILPFKVVSKARATYWKEYATLAGYARRERDKAKNGEYLYAATGGYRWSLEQARLIHPRNENEAINSVYNWTIQSVPPRLVYRMGLLLEKRIPEVVMQIVNSVYDCLCMYVRNDSVVDVCREIERARSEVMAAEDRWLKDVVIPADIKTGTSWGTLKEYKESAA